MEMVLPMLFFIGCVLLGYIVGKSKSTNAETNNKYMNAIIYFLLFILGLKLGVNEDVIAKLGSIGLQAVVMIVIICICSIIGMRVIFKMVMKNAH